MTALLVTGTGTGVGKTVVTAAIAALAVARGQTVSVLKPAQTGERDGEGGDLADIVRLVGPVRTVELARYPDPLSPEAAARISGRQPLTLMQCCDAVTTARGDSDIVLVEGAGGLLVRYNADGLTMAEVARRCGLPVVLVTAAGLGTLNATALTLEAMQARDLQLRGLVVGAWPLAPGLAERCNVVDLPALATQRLAGVLPEQAGKLSRPDFLDLARRALAPVLGGEFEPSMFEAQVLP
jgi:dethiobiotin synthetase